MNRDQNQSMNSRNNIKGFFSYARQNDKHGSGNLSSLRKNFEIELWEQTGENIEIFQDQEDIIWGELWKKKIIASLNSSKFLIAIITPSYLKSAACRFELEYFLDLEKTIGSERILPLIYIETPELRTTKDPVYSEISNRQWFDWTSLRFSSLTTTKAKKNIESFTKRIRELIVFDIPFTSINKTNFNIPNSVISKNISNELTPLSNKLTPEPKPNKKTNIDGELLQPPSNFPAGWDTEWQPTFDDVAATAIKSEAEFKKKEEPDVTIASYYPKLPKGTYEEKLPQQLTLILHSNGDSGRDRRRIKTLYGTLLSFHGKDKFSFQIFDNGKGHLIDFPNDTTRISPELLFRLNKLMGGEFWTIETITFK